MFRGFIFALIGAVVCVSEVYCLSDVQLELNVLETLARSTLKKVNKLQRLVKENGGCGETCPEAQICDDGWVYYKGSCYFFDYTTQRDFSNAKAFCAQYSANLLHVNDEDENNFIVDFKKQFQGNYYWLLGMTDTKEEGVWRWDDTKSKVKFTAWAPGQPQDEEDCACYFPVEWHDIGCDKKDVHAICEKRLQ